METVSLPPPEKERSRCSSSLSSELDETQADDPPLLLVTKKSLKQAGEHVDAGVDVDELEKGVHHLVIHGPAAVTVGNEGAPRDVATHFDGTFHLLFSLNLSRTTMKPFQSMYTL